MKSEKDSTIVDTRKKKPRTLTERVETKDRRKIRQEIARKMIGRTLADEVADLKRRMDAVEREQEATRKRLEKAGL